MKHLPKTIASSKQLRFPHNLLCVFFILICFSNANAQPDIYGGDTIDISEAPWQVSLEYDTLGHRCGGVILNSQWILTAAHCVESPNIPDIVHAGATEQTNNNIGQRILIDQIISYPYWDPVNASNDLALLHLAAPLCFNANVQPVIYATPQNTTPDDLQPGTPVFITGWGDAGNGCCSDILLGASIPIITHNEANSLITDPENTCLLGGASPVNYTMIPFYTEGISLGSGDSGGPATIEGSTGNPTLIGTASWGGCPKNFFPSIYAHVRELYSFIDDNISLSCPPCTCPDWNIDVWQNTVLDTDVDIPGDIIVHSGAELIVRGKIKMRQGHKILVSRNSRLKIESGGILTRGCDASDWEGIVVLGNKFKTQPNHDSPLSDSDQAGIVTLDNCTIEWAKKGIAAIGSGGNNFTGGLVWADGVNGPVVLQNNQIGADFGSYTFSSNKSLFNNVVFQEVGDAFANTEGVKINGTNGIEFSNCTFSNLDFEGIRNHDAAIKVLGNNRFEGNETGISSFATYPMVGQIVVGSSNAIENIFIDNTYHINASLTTGFYGQLSNGKFSLDVINNNFSGGEHGVIVEGPSNFRIAGNNFNDINISSWLSNTGFNNLLNENLIGCNEFNQGNNFGIIAIGENKEMQFLANDFVIAPNGRDFYSSILFSRHIAAVSENCKGAKFYPQKTALPLRTAKWTY